jgi:sugar phosphate isomerase/epimerase
MADECTRRGFVSSSLAVAGLAATGGMANAASAADAKPIAAAPAGDAAKRRFELGTVTYLLGKSMSVDELITTCERTQFAAVELRSTHAHGVEPDISKEQRKLVRQRFARSKVRLFALGSACEFHSEKVEVVKQNIELAKRFVELAADVGAVGVKVRPNGLPKGVPVEDTLRQIGHAIAEVARHAEKDKIELQIEVHGAGTSHPPYVKTIVDHAAHPLVGVTWNSNDTDLKDGSIAESFRLLAPHIRNVHMRDLYVNYPFGELFTLLKSIGYDRYALAEIPETKDPERVMRYYRKVWELMSA